MAKRLASYAFQSNRRSAYDWNVLLDRSIWVLYPGEDFTCTSKSLAAQASGAAFKRGLRVHTSIQDDGSVVIQAYKMRYSQ